MEITLVPDSSIALAPAGLTAAVEAAAAIYEQDFPGNYNINISYGWGTFDNTSSNELTNPSSGVYSLGGGASTAVSYSQLKGWLTANAVSSAQIAADATLPARQRFLSRRRQYFLRQLRGRKSPRRLYWRQQRD
jgi:hypothetical protein